MAALFAVAWTGLTGIANAAPVPTNLNSSSCPTDISQGQASGCVTELQNLLNQHGANLTVDGQFGSATLGAVVVFQTQTGIAADGIVGPVTKGALYDNSGAGLAGPINLFSSSCPTNIAQGASGGCVTELQNLLDDHGANLVVDGQFGPATLAAAQAFQTSAGLTADGIVGPNTKSALYHGGGASPTGAVDLRSPSCPSLMHVGLIDACVSTLQSLLDAHGQSIAVDGDFGPATLAAVEAFQSSSGLSADGVVGPNTKNALYNHVGGGSGAPGPINLTSSSCPNLIQQGEHDGCVTELQGLLNQHGAQLAMDGSFGPATFAAVEAFQSSSGLSVDGVVGPNTKNALYGGTGSTIQVGCILPPGATGCAGGDGLGARAVAIGYYLYNAPTSASQAADQQRIDDTYNSLDYLNRHAQYKLGSPVPGNPPSGPGLGGIPYVWGGGHWDVPGPHVGTCDGYTGSVTPCPADRTIGLDCSGLTRWLYAVAAGHDVLGSGNTDDQITRPAMHAVSKGANYSNLQPGDLIYWGTSLSKTHHVAMFLGKNVYVPGQGTGPAILEEKETGVSADINLISVSHPSGGEIGYFHVSESSGTA